MTAAATSERSGRCRELLRLAGWLLALSTLSNALWAPWSDPWFGFAGLLAVGLAWASMAPTPALAVRRGLITALGTITGYAAAMGVVAAAVALLDLELVFHYRALVQPSVMIALIGVVVLGALGGLARQIRSAGRAAPLWQRAAIALPLLVFGGAEAADERWVSAIVALLAAAWLQLMLAEPLAAGAAPAARADTKLDRLVRRLSWRAPLAFSLIAATNAVLFVATSSASGYYYMDDLPFEWSLVLPGAAGFAAVAIVFAARARSDRGAFGRGALLAALVLAGGAVVLTGWADRVGGHPPWSDGFVRLAGPGWASEAVDWTIHDTYTVFWQQAVVWSPFVIVLWFVPVLGVIARRLRRERESTRSLVLRAMLLAPFAMIVTSSAASRQPVAAVITALAAVWLDRVLRSADEADGPGVAEVHRTASSEPLRGPA